MELLFLAILLGLMALALGSGYPVASALPGASIATICLAAGAGYLFGGGVDTSAGAAPPPPPHAVSAAQAAAATTVFQRMGESR